MLMAHHQNYDFFNRNQASPFLQATNNPQATNQNSPLGSPTLNLSYHQPNNQFQLPQNTYSPPRFPGPSNQQGSGYSGQQTRRVI